MRLCQFDQRFNDGTFNYKQQLEHRRLCMKFPLKVWSSWARHFVIIQLPLIVGSLAEPIPTRLDENGSDHSHHCEDDESNVSAKKH